MPFICCHLQLHLPGTSEWLRFNFVAHLAENLTYTVNISHHSRQWVDGSSVSGRMGQFLGWVIWAMGRCTITDDPRRGSSGGGVLLTELRSLDCYAWSFLMTAVWYNTVQCHKFIFLLYSYIITWRLLPAVNVVRCICLCVSLSVCL